MFSSAEQNGHYSLKKYKDTRIALNDTSLAIARQIHHLLVDQDSGERSRAPEDSCL